MHTSLTDEQLLKFVLNDVNKEEREKIIEAITADPEIKERYLFEKRKHDVERYIYDEMDIGECCEIEELIKTDPRLYEHFELNTEPVEEEQEVSINVMHISITNEELVNFVLNNVSEEDRKKISNAININPLTKERYLFEKRKHDVERYLAGEMDFGECCEFEELLKINSRLHNHFELKKGVNDQEQDLSIKHTPITKDQLVNFILNKVNDEERKMISKAIDTKSLTKEKYLFEKRKLEVERYIAGKMDIGECCEIEELIKMHPGLYEHFELNNGVIEVEQDESVLQKQIPVTNEQLVNFVLSNVNEEERKKISSAIYTNPVTKERYLFEKRKHDVERYLNDEMDFGERYEMEEQIKINSRLYEYFELNKDVDVYLETALREQLNNIHAKLYDTDQNTTPVIKLKHNAIRIGKWIAAASIVMFVAFSGTMHFLSNRDSIEDRLYAKYYEPYSQMSAHLFNSSKLSEAKRLYSEGEYATSLLLLDNLQEVLLVQNEKYMYSGMALIELNRHKEAIEMFAKLNTSAGNETDVHIGYWYTGLCYLKIGDTENAIKYFKTITANNGYKREQAREILEKLNQ